MNILFLTPYVAWPLDHGGRIRTYHLLQALVPAHDVVNIAVARAPREREDAQELARIGVSVRPGLVQEPDMTLPARRLRKWLSLAVGRSSLPGRWFSQDFARIVHHEVATGRFDLAVIDTLWMDVYRPMLNGVPFVASTQNLEADVLLEAARQSTGVERPVVERDARLLLRHEARHFADSIAVVAVSNDDESRIRALAPSARVHVIENGVDTERLRPLPPPRPEDPLLFVGSFDYSANVDAAEYLVNAVMPAVRTRVGPATAILAGRSPPQRVHALARFPGVEVTGTVLDLVPLYARAGAVVVPIRFGGGSRLKIIEALALARPVVTTTAGARGLALENGVHCLLADTPDAFASALLKLRTEPGLAASLARAGRSFVEAHHAWPALERRFAELIQGLSPRPAS